MTAAEAKIPKRRNLMEIIVGANDLLPGRARKQPMTNPNQKTVLNIVPSLLRSQFDDSTTAGAK